jgi:hypothetical protein
MAQGVPFIVTEIPNADPFMLHIYAAVAEQERTKISERTKAALAGQQGVEAQRQQADARAQQLSEILSEFAGQSANAIAKALNDRGLPSARGGKWTARSTPFRLLPRVRLGALLVVPVTSSTAICSALPVHRGRAHPLSHGDQVTRDDLRRAHRSGQRQSERRKHVGKPTGLPARRGTSSCSAFPDHDPAAERNAGLATRAKSSPKLFDQRLPAERIVPHQQQNAKRCQVVWQFAIGTGIHIVDE